MAESTNVELMLRNVRTSYFYGFQPYVSKPDANGKTNSSYSSHFLLPPDHPDLPAIRAAIKTVAQGMWKDKAAEMLTGLMGQDRICLHKGDISKPGEEAYKGMFYVSAGNGNKRFSIVETRGDQNVALVEADGRPYSGCFVNAKIAVWAQSNSWGKRINAQLQGVQFLRHGDAFGGGKVARADEFDKVPVAMDADAPPPAAAETADPMADLLG